MNETDENPFKVFLCHSSNDKQMVRNLYNKLLQDGVDAWLDEEKLLGGQDWDLEIRKSIRKTDVVIVFLSSKSVTKEGYVQKEIRFALDIADEKPEGTVFIIPVKLDDCEMPERLSKWHWIHLRDEKSYEKIIHTLSARANELTKKFQPLHRRWEPEIERFDNIEFVRVPSGAFIMGSKEEDPMASDTERPQFRMLLPYDYWIARFPTTNYQFEKFINATGYVTKAETLGGWSFEKNEYIKGINWRYPQYPSVGIKKKENHPVVQICWHDANAYCRWISEKLQPKLPRALWVRLPTEAEWEKAARGVEGSEFPWGNYFDSNRCNTEESGLKDTTPVGMYSPYGDSPFGAADMTGNVWEWTHSLAEPYPYSLNDRRESEKVPDATIRILRGGSFFGTRPYMRCAYRYSDYSISRFRYFGFRIVISQYQII